MIAGFSREQILHEALVAPRGALVPLADSIITERPGWWQLMTPSLARGGMNEVVCTHLPEADGDAILDATIASYRRLGIRFRWTIHPGTSPADLGERLARRGLTRTESLVMARATHGAPSPDSGAIRVEEVSLANIDEYTQVMATGWGSEPAALDVLHRRMLAAPDGHHHLFLARHEGTPAATGAHVALAGSAYLMGAVALPELRGRGLYRALVHARLRHAEAHGLALATSVAQVDTSAPVLARLGFETLCSISSFVDG